MRHRVAITGVGVICAMGDSPAQLHSGLCNGDISSYLFDESGPQEHSRPHSGRIPWFNPNSYLKGRNLRPLDRTGQLVVAASGLALADSGWTTERRASHDCGLALGTMFGSVHTIGKFDREALRQGPAYASPMDFANTVINAAAGQTAIWHDLRGINSTVASGSSSGLAALGYAADLIRSGSESAMLAGGVEEFCFESCCGFERAHMLSRASLSGSFPIPFHRTRDGFALGEACALLMLEDRETAMERGALILGEIRGHGSVFDGKTNLQAAAIARSMRSALQDAELLPSQIDCISASANGSFGADRDEAVAVGSVFNGHGNEIPVTAIKSMLGETLGASGPLQAVDLIETIKTHLLPGIRGLSEMDPGFPKLNFSGEAREIDAQFGLINAVGFDGNVDSLVISGPWVN